MMVMMMMMMMMRGTIPTAQTRLHNDTSSGDLHTNETWTQLQFAIVDYLQARVDIR